MKRYFQSDFQKNKPCAQGVTDLALENADFTHSVRKMGGFTVTSSTFDGKTSTTLHIGNAGALDRARRRAAARVCGEIISELFDAYKLPSIAPVTVICLGNSSVCVDALGALCAKKVYATRHLKSELPKLFSALGGREISVICTGVTAETGIDALEITKWCIQHLKPSLIITVDALKASKAENLLSVIQIASEVTPGSGTDSTRPEISQKSTGVPVISIGVPTVISPFTIALDIQNNHSIAPTTRQNAKNHPKTNQKNIPLLVSTADCEKDIRTLASIVADAINLTLLGTFFD